MRFQDSNTFTGTPMSHCVIVIKKINHKIAVRFVQ